MANFGVTGQRREGNGMEVRVWVVCSVFWSIWRSQNVGSSSKGRDDGLKLLAGEKVMNGDGDMAPRRAYVRRNAGENVEPEVHQVLIEPLAEQVTHAKFQASFQVLDQYMMTQANREVVAPMNPNMGSSNALISKFNKDMVPNPKPQGVCDNRYYIPICQRCGKCDSRKCLVDMDSCFGCGKSGHKVMDSPPQDSKDHEGFINLMTSMLKVFHFDVYASLHLSATLLFVTPYVAMRFDVGLKILSNPFHVSTPVGDSIVAKRVYRNCPIYVARRATYVDLVEFDTLDFDIILKMDWLYSCYASLDCRNRLITFKVPNKPIMSWGKGNYVLKGQSISCLKSRKMISKGCIHHLVWDRDIDFETPTF
ncbi:hypothetical protein MTR67_001184 [Solanum verrucosum]|uniref:Gag-pol polyprotein n=1 Tax=Solanum verrucosum TaxID=315347 RepID=A0AAF0PMP5_SOLVR|nr:hypothetical protein MTR67_001184 [Solanum verrucosum]